MTMTLPIKDLSSEQDWLREKRKESQEALKTKPFPDRVSHLWKYSDPKIYELNGKEITNERINLVFTIDSEAIKKGIVLEELNEVQNKNLSNYFGQLTKNNQSRITLLNEAFWSSGVFLFVPKNIKHEKPIRVKTIYKGLNSFSATRGLIILEENASINLIDEISSDEGQADNLATNIVIEIFLVKGAKLNYLNLQTLSKQVTHHLFQKTEIQDHAEFNNLIVSLGSKISKAELVTSLVGNSSSVSTYGIVLGDELQKFDHHTTIEHIAPHTKSELNFRVALKDKARSAYTGNLKIAHEAVKSDAHQENRNLLLSEDAKAESIPELEILTNDVIRCNHGVTVGQVDKDQVFYLMSRGLTHKEAERIITLGFLEPTISQIPDESLKEEILKSIEAKLENL